MDFTTEYLNISTVAPTRPSWWHGLNTAFSVLMPVILIIIMFAMGCNITVSEIWKVLKRPIPLIIGASCQFVLLPLVTFGMAHALRMSNLSAIGMLIWASSPGGSVSNIFSYWVDGDLPLSVTMTSFSTVAALGMMPLNLFIYTRSWTSQNLVIPYTNILIALASILVPVAFGMLLRWKKPGWANKILTVGSISGLLVIALAVGMQSALNPSMYNTGWKIYFSAFLMPLIGYSLGFSLSKIFCLTYKTARTVAYETGVQTISLPITVVTLSYSSETASQILLFIFLCGGAGMINGFLTVAAYKIYRKAVGEKDKEGNIQAHHLGLDEKGEKDLKRNVSEEDELERKKVLKSTVAGLNNKANCSDDGTFKQL